MATLQTITGGNGQPGSQTGEEVKDMINENFEALNADKLEEDEVETIVEDAIDDNPVYFSSRFTGTGAILDPITIGTDLTLVALQALGSVVKAQSVGLNLVTATNSSLTLSDGQERFVAVYLDKAATITGVKWYQGVQGVYTADNENRLGLYTYAAGTMTLVASSVDDGNIWKAAANALVATAFSTPYDAAVGIYFVGLLYNSSAASTPPAVKGGVQFTSSMAIHDFTNNAKLVSQVAATTLKTTQVMGGVSETSLVPLVFLY